MGFVVGAGWIGAARGIGVSARVPATGCLPKSVSAAQGLSAINGHWFATADATAVKRLGQHKIPKKPAVRSSSSRLLALSPSAGRATMTAVKPSAARIRTCPGIRASEDAGLPVPTTSPTSRLMAGDCGALSTGCQFPRRISRARLFG